MNSLIRNSSTFLQIANPRLLYSTSRCVTSAAVNTDVQLKSHNEIPGPRILPFFGSGLSQVMDKRKFLY